MRLPIPLILSLAASSALLAACGGGNDEDPAVRPIPASVAVSNATNTAFNGTYASSNISLTRVDNVAPVGSDTVCTFKFSGLQQQGSSRLMSGDIRYLPFTNNLRTTFITIEGAEWQMSGTQGATVDRANNRIVFQNSVLTGSNGQNGTITLTGNVPMLGDRPQDGC